MISGPAVILSAFKVVGFNLCVGLALIWYATSRQPESRAEAIERFRFDVIEMSFLEGCEAVRDKYDLAVARSGGEQVDRPWNEKACVCITDRLDQEYEKARKFDVAAKMFGSLGEAAGDPPQREGVWATLVSLGRKSGLDQRESEMLSRELFNTVRFCTKDRRS